MLFAYMCKRVEGKKREGKGRSEDEKKGTGRREEKEGKGGKKEMAKKKCLLEEYKILY